MTDQYRPQLTTHAGWGEGAPRLRWHNEHVRGDFELDDGVTRIGSGRDSEIAIPGLEETHAIIRHTVDDEFVLTLYGPGETSANPDPDGTGHPGDIVLRTGAQLRIGPHTFVYVRDEIADHGRPHGGREGGEFEEQPEQARRPNYLEGETSRSVRGPEPPLD